MSRNKFADEVIDTLENAVRGRQILVVSSPHSGKTKFLEAITSQMAVRQRNWVAFSSGAASTLFTHDFFEKLLNTLKSEGCLDQDFFLENKPTSLISFFTRIDSALYKENIRHLVILVDDLDEGKMKLEDIANLLSTVRGFYTEWKEIEINIHFVFVGNVNSHVLLGIYRGADGASWPLQQGKTIFYLPRLTIEEIKSKIAQLDIQHIRSMDLYASYLFELSHGDAFTTSHIFKVIERQKITCELLFEAAEKLVNKIEWAKDVGVFASNLSKEASKVIMHNLRGQAVVLPERDLKEELLLSGLCRINQAGAVCLLNPIIERTLRKYWGQFFPALKDGVFTNVTEFIPQIFTLNKKAFELISEIEMLLRNIAVAQLGIQNKKNQQHLLSGLNYEVNRNTELKEDQYIRSRDWKDRVAKSRYVNAHAALISYTDTKDILGLIDHLISINDPVVAPLKSIRTQLSGLKEIRDSVMHGQVINEQSVENLMDIYYDLNKELAIKME